jgi:hypothetical protein
MKRLILGAAALLLLAAPIAAQQTPSFLPERWGVGTGTKTATATAGAATLSKSSGVITTEALTTAAGAAYTLTLTNTEVGTTDIVLASLNQGTNSAGLPVLVRASPGNGSATFIVQNMHASAALNGTLQVRFVVFNATP